MTEKRVVHNSEDGVRPRCGNVSIWRWRWWCESGQSSEKILSPPALVTDVNLNIIQIQMWIQIFEWCKQIQIIVFCVTPLPEFLDVLCCWCSSLWLALSDGWPAAALWARCCVIKMRLNISTFSPVKTQNEVNITSHWGGSSSLKWISGFRPELLYRLPGLKSLSPKSVRPNRLTASSSECAPELQQCTKIRPGNGFLLINHAGSDVTETQELLLPTLKSSRNVNQTEQQR